MKRVPEDTDLWVERLKEKLLAANAAGVAAQKEREMKEKRIREELVEDTPALPELTHARHDPAHCLAPGLFQSLNFTWQFSKFDLLQFSD